MQSSRLARKGRNDQDFKSILVLAHLLGGRKDDLQHELSAANKEIAVEYGLFWPFMGQFSPYFTATDEGLVRLAR